MCVRGLLLLVLALPGTDPVPQAKGELEGTWTVVAVQHDGENAPPEDVRRLRAIFTGDKLQLKHGDEIRSFTFRVDPAKKPAVIDLTPMDGPQKDQVIHGIYQLADNTLKLCLPLETGKDRPEAFAAPARSGLFLLELRREKP
jgi:uncharacterized protein (TIGR03067 family)